MQTILQALFLMKLKALFLFFFILQISYSQESYPQDYFINPLKIPLSLSGNFAELRANHFHSGLDIRTQQRTGLDVVATANGYISRLKMGPWGYGNVLYVTHPNGYTTVYGHLDEFAPKIRKYIRERQYKLEKNNLELYPDKEDLPVIQGEVIAKSGNTGGSGGPHLHYEFRDSLQRALNPLLFGVKIEDTRPPHISGLYVYPAGTDAYANRSGKLQSLQLSKQEDGTYTTTPVEALGQLGFGITAIDYNNSAPFKTGLYNISTSVNGTALLSLTFDQFSFGKTHYINQYVDYQYNQENKKRIQKLFMEPGNLIDISIDAFQNGYIQVEEGMDYDYRIVLKDFSGNETVVRVPVKGKRIDSSLITPAEEEQTDYFAYWNKPNVFELSYHDIFIPKGALYNDASLDLADDPTKVKVHRPDTPLKKQITIGFDGSKYSAADLEKVYVARIFENSNRTYYTATHKNGTRIIARTSTFGTYTLTLDKTAPEISPVNFKDGEWVSNLPFLKLKIKDTDSGIATYRGTINDRFVVLEYDYKTGIIKYDFRDGKTQPGENTLKITVTDNVGNSTTYQTSFYRKS